MLDLEIRRHRTQSHSQSTSQSDDLATNLTRHRFHTRLTSLAIGLTHDRPRTNRRRKRINRLPQVRMSTNDLSTSSATGSGTPHPSSSAPTSTASPSTTSTPTTSSPEASPSNASPPTAYISPTSPISREWRRRILNFTPSWFSVNMGTGITSILLHNLPYQFNGLKVIGIVVFLFNISLFTGFFVVTA